MLPSTNNGLESTNGHVKDDWLSRRKDKVGVFLGIVKQFLADCSAKSENFALLPTPEISLWREANLALGNGRFVVENVPDSASGMTRFLVGEAGRERLLSPEQYIDMFDNPWGGIGTWGDYKLLQKEWHVVTATANGFSTCTCSAGFKRYRCVHSLAVDLGTGLVQLPDGAKPLPQCGGRKRGRPARVTGGFGGKSKGKK